MSVITFPSGLKPSRSTWELVDNTRVFRSPITNSIQTTSRKGAFWKISLQFDNLFDDKRAEMQAFLVALEGQKNRFDIYDHAFTRRGTGAQSGWTSATSSGNTLNLSSGVAASLSVKAGDYIGFSTAGTEHQLFMATSDASVTSGTSLAISVSPSIRDLQTGQAVELTAPAGRFIMVNTAAWDTKPGIFSSFTLEAVEDVLA
jgi:hypothetical protein